VKTLVLVLGCRAAPYPELIAAIKRTWASVGVDGVEVLFYDGNAVEATLEGRDLHLPVADDLDHVGEKTIACFEWALRHRDFGLVFRTNASSYIDLPNLRTFVDAEAAASGYYAGKGANVDSIDFALGSGFFLSRDLVELVVEKRSEWDREYMDDIALGKLLSANGVRRGFAPRTIVGRPKDAERIDLTQFFFACRTMSGPRDVGAEIEAMERIHARFLAVRSGVRSALRRRRLGRRFLAAFRRV
jgi:hypothetical protein